jgi:hypothetical protein
MILPMYIAFPKPWQPNGFRQREWWRSCRKHCYKPAKTAHSSDAVVSDDKFEPRLHPQQTHKGLAMLWRWMWMFCVALLNENDEFRLDSF